MGMCITGIRSPKITYDPLCGAVDIDDISPIVDSPYFQRLRHLKQLSFTHLVYPGAEHTRFLHSIGSYSATRRVARRWRTDGVINRDQERALFVYALIHDIGHPAFSHVTEDFSGDHKVQGLKIVQELRDTIFRCEVDTDRVIDLMQRKQPLHALVDDKNIGLEKLDYLERDGLATGHGSPSGAEYVRKYVYWTGSEVTVDEKMSDHVCSIMLFYADMYKNVYLRKSLLIAQRHFHKMVHSFLRESLMPSHELFQFTDADLIGALTRSRLPETQRLFRWFQTRQLFKEAVVIRGQLEEQETRTFGKAIATIGVGDEELSRYLKSPCLQKGAHERLEALEASIAFALKVDPEAVLVVPVMYPERFKVADVKIHNTHGQSHSLRARREACFKSLEAKEAAYRAVRVCVRPEYRERASHAAQGIRDILRDFVR